MGHASLRTPRGYDGPVMRPCPLPTLLSALALAAASTAASSALAADWYVSVDGTDPSGCENGTAQSPWRTWTVPRAQGCIQPGDTVYFMAGVYESGAGVFDGGDSKTIRFEGESGAPIRLARDPQAAGDWPVTFRGSFSLGGEWGSIEGIEVEGTGVGNVVMVNASHVTLDGCLVRGRLADVDPDTPGDYDCVKILAGHPDQLEDIQVLGCTIRDCPEDAIDVTGARDLVYRNNDISNSWVIQVKGGTENILIEQNLFHDVRNGLNGAGMGIDMGSVVIPTLPIDERFVAKNVVVRNNVIYGVDKWATIGAHGWQNAEIYHNTIYQAATNLLIVHSAGFDTTDPIAAAYCNANPCDPCSNGEPDCWHLDFQARDVKFKNNIVHSPDSYAIRAYSAALEGFEAANNLYYSPDGEVTFRLDGDSHSLASFPYESDSQEIDPGLMDVTTHDFTLREDSVAIDSGADLGVATDFLGLPRDATPDIGAYEYGAVPAGGGGAGGTGGSATGGSGGHAGTGTGGTSPAAPPPPTEDDSGCGCRQAPRPSPFGPVTGWLLSGLLVWARRRRTTHAGY